jgi:hypothetical protein
VVNSGRLYGGLRPTPPPPPMSRDERVRRIRAHALEFVEATVPGIRDCIREKADELCSMGRNHPGTCRVHDEARRARGLVGKLAELMTRFGHDTPVTPEARQALAQELSAAYIEFEGAYQALGFRISQTDSLAGFLARHLYAEVDKIADFLRDS